MGVPASFSCAHGTGRSAYFLFLQYPYVPALYNRPQNVGRLGTCREEGFDTQFLKGDVLRRREDHDGAEYLEFDSALAEMNRLYAKRIAVAYRGPFCSGADGY